MYFPLCDGKIISEIFRRIFCQHPVLYVQIQQLKQRRACVKKKLFGRKTCILHFIEYVWPGYINVETFIWEERQGTVKVRVKHQPKVVDRRECWK
jgi:hypothetical protein